MSKKKDTFQNLPIHRKINHRSTQAMIQRLIVEHVIPMLGKNMTFGEICDELRVITGKSASQCERYINRAYEELSKDFNRDSGQQRMEAVTSLREDLREAYANYSDGKSVMWWKEYQAIKERLHKLSPLQNDIKEEDQAITISYKVIEPTDD